MGQGDEPVVHPASNRPLPKNCHSDVRRSVCAPGHKGTLKECVIREIAVLVPVKKEKDGTPLFSSQVVVGNAEEFSKIVVGEQVSGEKVELLKNRVVSLDIRLFLL
jgi:hypothetical protein